MVNVYLYLISVKDILSGQNKFHIHNFLYIYLTGFLCICSPPFESERWDSSNATFVLCMNVRYM